MQRAEIVFFTRPDETAATTSLLSRFTTQPVDEEIVDLGGRFYRTWQPGSGTDVNDALLAATVATIGGIVVTLNVKHYPMPEISVHRAW